MDSEVFLKKSRERIDIDDQSNLRVIFECAQNLRHWTSGCSFDDALEAELIFDFCIAARDDGKNVESGGEFGNEPQADLFAKALGFFRVLTREGQLK